MRWSARRTALILVCAAVLIGLPLLWRWTPLSEWADVDNILGWFAQLRQHGLLPLWVMLAYVIGAVLFLPINLFIFVTALLFNDVRAYVFVALGVGLDAVTGYTMGRLGGTWVMRRIGSDRLDAIAREVADADFVELFLFRLVPVTPFSTVNVVCGTLKMPLLRFAGATFASIAPGATLIIVFERSLAAFLGNMTWHTAALLLAALSAVVGGMLFLKRWASRRRRRAAQ